MEPARVIPVFRSDLGLVHGAASAVKGEWPHLPGKEKAAVKAPEPAAPIEEDSLDKTAKVEEMLLTGKRTAAIKAVLHVSTRTVSDAVKRLRKSGAAPAKCKCGREWAHMGNCKGTVISRKPKPEPIVKETAATVGMGDDLVAKLRETQAELRARIDAAQQAINAVERCICVYQGTK